MEVPGIVLQELGKLPELKAVEVRDPGPKEVLVRMVASGICHTDVSYMRDAREVPVLLGHEGAGVVEEIGSKVTGVSVGDHVVINWQVKCHRCHNCHKGRPDLCEDIQGTTAPRLLLDGKPLPAMLNAGTFCPWAVVPAEGAIPIRQDMPLDLAAMLGCAVATGVGAAWHTAKVGAGDSVVVIGAGGVGLNVVQGARLANAGLIVSFDRNPARWELAKEFGADVGFGPLAGDPVEKVLDLTEGRGVDHVFEVVGVPELMLQGIDMLARGGVLTLVGAAARDAVLPFQPRRFMSRQQQIRACIYGNIRPTIDLPLFADLYMRRRLKLDPVRAESLPLHDVPDLFARYDLLTGIRPVVLFEGAQ